MLRPFFLTAALILGTGIQTVSAAPGSCEDWLKSSALQKYIENPPKSATYAPTIDETIKAYKFSEHRLDAKSYVVLAGFLGELQVSMMNQLGAAEISLQALSKHYRGSYSMATRWLPFGEAAGYRRAHIQPLKDEIKFLKAAIEDLDVAILSTATDSNSFGTEKYLSDGRRIYGSLSQVLPRGHAMGLARALMGNPVDVTAKTARYITAAQHIQKVTSKSASYSLALRLIESGRSDDESLKQLVHMYIVAKEKIPEDQAVALTLSTFQKNPHISEMSKALGVFGAVNSVLKYYNDPNETIRVTNYFIDQSKVPSVSEIKAVYEFRERINRELQYTITNKDLAFGFLLKLYGPQASSKDVQALASQVSRYHRYDGVSVTAATLLAMTEHAVGVTSAEFTKRIISVYQSFYKLNGVSSASAALMAMKIVLLEKGVSSQYPQLGVEVSRLREAYESSTDSSSSDISFLYMMGIGFDDPSNYNSSIATTDSGSTSGDSDGSSDSGSSDGGGGGGD